MPARVGKNPMRCGDIPHSICGKRRLYFYRNSSRRGSFRVTRIYKRVNKEGNNTPERKAKMPFFEDRRDAVAQRELLESERRERAYRGDRPAPEIRDRTIILVDDGLATGASMRAAIAGVRAKGPARIVVAVPTAASETCEAFESEVDEIVCAKT